MGDFSEPRISLVFRFSHRVGDWEVSKYVTLNLPKKVASDDDELDGHVSALYRAWRADEALPLLSKVIGSEGGWEIIPS